MLARSRPCTWICSEARAWLPIRVFVHRAFGTFQLGDRILLKHVDKPHLSPIYTRPLQLGGRSDSQRGAFLHNDIIGKQPREVIESSSGRQARLHHPTLSEHITLTRRLVTPIYPDTAERIVSLLDIHVDASFPRESGRPFQILEAGTGHGSLTLHLARAVCAANAHISVQEEANNGEQDVVHAMEKRGAIIHTTDISAANSRCAKTVISEFRRGIYAKNVNFHVGDVASFLQCQQQTCESLEPFLDGVVLDLPAAHTQVEIVAGSIVVDGILALFCPSVTQITDALRLIRKKCLYLALEQVIELNSITSGGRAWDLRFVTPRAVTRAKTTQSIPQGLVDSEESTEVDLTIQSSTAETEKETSDMEDDHNLEIICRPKFGDMVTAGGFLALFKKIDT